MILRLGITTVGAWLNCPDEFGLAAWNTQTASPCLKLYCRRVANAPTGLFLAGSKIEFACVALAVDLNVP